MSTFTTSALVGTTSIEQVRGGKLVAVPPSGSPKFGQTIACGGEEYLPCPLDPMLERVLRLPAALGKKDPADQVITELFDLLATRRDLGAAGSTIAATFAVATWMADTIPTPPILNLYGREAWCSSTPLLIEAVCRRPLPLANLAIADLLQLPVDLCPTIVLREPTRNRLRDLLAFVQRPGSGALHQGRFLTFRASVLIVSKHPVELPGVLATPVLAAPAAEPPLLTVAGLNEVAESLGARLLRYRVSHRPSMASVAVDAAGYNPVVRAAAEAWIQALAPLPEMQKRLLPALREVDEFAKTAYARSPAGEVLSACLTLILEGSKRALVQEIADLANGSRSANGDRDLTAKACGLLLRNELAIQPRRGTNGFEVFFDDDLSASLKARGESYGLHRMAPIDDENVQDVHVHSATSEQLA
jgi:hypothetical protein